VSIVEEARVNAPPSVSIIVPAYNTSQYIVEAVESARAQTFSDYEIIVINDGSDDTEELERVLAPYMDDIVYIKQENRGSSAARNAGLRQARGEYVALLDSDDIWEPEYLAVHVEALKNDPSIDIIFPNARLFGDTPQAGLTYMDTAPLEGDITFARLLEGKCYVWGGVTARREAFVRAGCFDEKLGTAEDLDLWLRVLRQGGRITYHRRVLAHYRKRPGSHTSDSRILCRNFLKLLDKIEQIPDLTDNERKVVERGRTYMLAQLRVYEGKRAFVQGDTGTAIRELSAANWLIPSRKRRAIIACLRIAPGLARAAYRLRTRLVGE